MRARMLLAATAAVWIAMPTVLLSQASPSRPAAAVAAKPAAWPDRAIRHDIPMTNMIERAFAAGTRDSSGRPGKNYWQIWNEYTINARFDPPTAMVSGRETIVVHNNGPNPMTAIQMRLDQNLFAANVPKAEVVTDITDGMRITKLSVNGQPVDLSPRAGRGRGGRGGFGGADTTGPRVPTATGLNLTSARVTPATPIPPGGTATLDVEWNFRVPKSDPPTRGIRMGSWGDSLFQIGQWYPRVAVFDDLRQGGWDTDPYLGPSEFYNNLGHYDVKLDLPSGWLVGSTGTLQNPQDVYTADERQRLSHVLESDSQQVILEPGNFGPGKATAAGDRLIWHFTADTVGDVAWATSRSFEWDATRANIPGRGYIPIYIMFLPGHQAFKQQGATGRHALEFYSSLWMPYAFPSLTQVDGPENGMEYPMFIMASNSTDHEIGHQWWPMTDNTNETWYGFMDEGFNQYMNILSNADFRGGRGGRGGGGGGGGRGGAGNGNCVLRITGGGNAAALSATNPAVQACDAALRPGGRLALTPTATAADSARARQFADSLLALGVTAPTAGRGAFAGGGGGGGGGRGGAARTGVEAMNPPGGTALLNGQGQRFGAVSGDERLAPLMWDANYGGPQYQEQAYSRAPMMLSMLGGVVGDSAVWKAMSGYAKAWRFKHPSPWDYAFFMSNALHKDLGWFWYYWLFTTESVDGSIQHVATVGTRTTVTVREDGQMPSPVVLAVQFAPKGPPIRQMANSVRMDSVTALVTYPVDVWWSGSKTFRATLDFGGRTIEKITFDPFGRFPDRNVSDNVWPRDTAAAPAGRGGRRGRGGD